MDDSYVSEDDNVSGFAMGDLHDSDDVNKSQDLFYRWVTVLTLKMSTCHRPING